MYCYTKRFQMYPQNLRQPLEVFFGVSNLKTKRYFFNSVRNYNACAHLWSRSKSLYRSYFMVFDGSVLTRNHLKLLLYYNDDYGAVWRMFRRRAVSGLPVAGGSKSAEVDVRFPEGCEKDQTIIFASLCKNSG